MATKYRVLREIVSEDPSDPDRFEMVAAEVEAHGPQQAIRAAAKEGVSAEDLALGLDLIAIPVSNWTEEPVRIEQPPPRLVVGSNPEPIAGTPDPVEPEEQGSPAEGSAEPSAEPEEEKP